MTDLLKNSIEMVNILYLDGEYREALNGLFLIKKSKPYGDNEEFNKLVDNLIEECFKKLKKSSMKFYPK